MRQITTKQIPKPFQRHAKKAGMTQIAIKIAPHLYPQTYKEGKNDANSDKILALALLKKYKQGHIIAATKDPRLCPKTYKEGGNDAYTS